MEVRHLPSLLKLAWLLHLKAREIRYIASGDVKTEVEEGLLWGW